MFAGNSKVSYYNECSVWYLKANGILPSNFHFVPASFEVLTVLCRVTESLVFLLSFFTTDKTDKFSLKKHSLLGIKIT